MHIEDVAADDNGLDLRYFQTLFFFFFFFSSMILTMLSSPFQVDLNLNKVLLSAVVQVVHICALLLADFGSFCLYYSFRGLSVVLVMIDKRIKHVLGC